MDAADLLEAVADDLEQNGWIGGGEVLGPNGEQALVVALTAESSRYLLPMRVYDEAVEALRATIGATGDTEDRREPLFDWNDAPGRTLAEVLGACRRAVERLREADSVVGSEGGGSGSA